MPDFTPIFQAAGAQYNVDPTMLRAIAMKESSMNPAAVNPASGASGLMGFTPATAKSYGINPLDPQQAIPTAARMFAENLKRFNGNIEEAVAAHFAGPDQKLWGPKTSQYVDQVSGIFGQMKRGSPAAQEAPQAADPVLAMAQSIQKGGSAATAPQSAPATASSDPILAMAQGIASGKSAAALGAPAVAPIQASADPVGADQAQDLAAGGASPDTLSQLGAIARAGAHGVGSILHNAANFAERHLPFVPNDIAARDTAIQAQADQQFSQQASPGEKAAAFVAPMLIPMSGAMAPGNAVRAGIARLTPNAIAPVGRAVGAALGNAVNGGIMATGAPIDPNQPVGPQDARNVAVGAGLGVALPAVAAAGKAVGSNIYGAVRPILNPRDVVGEGVANFLGDEAGNVASNLRSAPTYVSGYQPTSAQLGGNVGLVATEKAAANADPNLKIALAQRGVNNNATLWNALDKVAGNQDDLSNLIARRDTATTPLYNIAKQQNIPVDEPMAGLLSRPAMQKAINRAQTGADNRNAGPIMETIETANPFSGATGAPGSTLTTMTGNGAQRVKEAFDAMLMPENTNKLSEKEIGDIRDTREAFMSWLESHSPEFTQARQTYAAMSPPINSMEAAQKISERLGGLGRSMDVNQNPVLTATGYATALSQALKNQEFGIEPKAQMQLENIGHELQRATISNSLKSAGSDTAYNLAANGWLARNLYGPQFGGSTGLGRVLAGAVVTATGHPWAGLGVAGGIGKIGTAVGGRLNAQLSDLLLNPEALLPYLNARAAGPVNGTQQALASALRRQIVPAVVSGVSRRGLVEAP